MQRLVNDQLSRLLHNALYQRMLSFCEQYTPELPGAPVVTAWLNRLYLDDDLLHILVELDADYNITWHAVVEVVTAYGHNIVVCHQTHSDKPNIALFETGLEYVDKLRQHINATCSMFFTAKHVKALSKKYGYKVVRTVMMKRDVDEGTFDGK